MKTQNGFSLIELMIVVAVVGILMAIAVPNYTDYLIRGRIPDATSGLSTRRVQMEQWFQDNRTYVGAICPVAADTGSSQNFDFLCVSAPTTFVWTATGKGRMAGFAYTITETGNKSSVIAAPAPTRWQATSPVAPATTGGCWVNSTGGSC